MRIAISADDDNGIDSVVSPHFGRCPFFVLVDVEDGRIGAVHVEKNPYYPDHQPGQIPGFIGGLGANVMMAGGMGRRAIMFFDQLGIEGVTGAHGSARQAIERYLGGGLAGAAPCAESVAHQHDHSHQKAEYEEDDVGRLKEEVQMLKDQLEEAAKRVSDLGSGDKKEERS